MSFNCLITTLGQAKIAAAFAGGTQIDATHIAIGDGNGNAVTPAVSQLALVREVHRANVSSIIVNPDDPTQVIFEAVIVASVGGWTARELGLFDSDGDMIAVANIGSVYKPTVAEGSAREMVVRIYAQVDQVSAINLVVDPSFYVATRSWVNANFSLAALFPGGTTGQILRKKTNASGDTEWADPFASQNITVDVVEEIQTLASGQTVVNLSTATTSGMAVYVEGIRLRSNQFTVGSATQFTLGQSYPAGSKLLAVQNDPAASLDFLRQTLNLSDLPSKPTARTNLGLGSMATKADTDYPTNAAVAAGYVSKSGDTMTGDLNLPGISKTESGYSRLPNGLILQWGRVNSGDGGYNIVYPVAFPTAALSVVASTSGSSGGPTQFRIYVNSVTTTGFYYFTGGGGSSSSHWLAIGY